jgi:hypothetical protein
VVIIEPIIGNTANHSVRSPLTVQTKNVALCTVPAARGNGKRDIHRLPCTRPINERAHAHERADFCCHVAVTRDEISEESADRRTAATPPGRVRAAILSMITESSMLLSCYEPRSA